MERLLNRSTRVVTGILMALGLVAGVLILMSRPASGGIAPVAVSTGYTSLPTGEAATGTLILPQVVTTIPVSPGIGFGPSAIGVNPATGYIYVANSLSTWWHNWESHAVSVLSGTQVITNVHVPGRPTDIVVNPASGYVYVALDTDDLAVLSGTQVITTILGIGGAMSAVNPATSLVYAARPGGEVISVLSGIEVAATITVASSLRGIGAAPDSGLVYVAAYPREGTLIYQGILTVLSGTQVITTVTGLTGGPTAVGVNPTNGYVYVANSLTDTVTVVSGTDVDVDFIPVDLAMNPTTGMGYVVGPVLHSQEFGGVVVVVLSGTQIVTRLNAKKYPSAVGIAPTNDYVYIANGDDVMVLSGTQVITTLPTVTDYPSVLKAHPANGYVYVSSNDGISVLSETRVITSIGTGDYYDAHFIDVDSTSGYVYAVSAERLDNWDMVSNVWIVSETQVITQVTVEGSPTAFAVNPVNGYAYVATDNKRMSILSRMQVITTFSMAAQINAIAANPASGYVYAANSNNTVSVLSGTQVVETLPVGDYPVDIAIQPATGLVYVVNYYGQSITVIANVPALLFRVYLPLVLRKAGALGSRLLLLQGCSVLTQNARAPVPGAAHATARRFWERFSPPKRPRDGG